VVLQRTWFVVADGAQARIFETEDASSPFREVERSLSADARQKSVNLNSDRPGRTFDSHGHGRHAMQPGTDPQMHEKVQFVDRLGSRLNEAALRQAFDRLVLIAPPRPLGQLRRKLNRQASDRVTAEIDKDLTGLTGHEIQEYMDGVHP